MIHFTPRRPSGTPALPLARDVIAVALLSLSLSPLHAADGPDPQLPVGELIKVERAMTDTETDGAAPPASSAKSGGRRLARPAPSQEFFEELLRRQYAGTYSFFRRLPERSRDEVFHDYSSGASVAALREKIIDRFLHP